MVGFMCASRQQKNNKPVFCWWKVVGIVSSKINMLVSSCSLNSAVAWRIRQADNILNF